jgi:hypothetical protein
MASSEWRIEKFPHSLFATPYSPFLNASRTSFIGAISRT